MAYYNGHQLAGFRANITEGGGGGYEQGYEDGKNSVIDIMFYAENIPSFKYANFPTDTELIINIPRFSRGNNTANLNIGDWGFTTGLKKLKVISSAEITEGLVFSTTFNSSSIEELDLTEFPRLIKSILSGFINCKNIKRILGELDLTNCTLNGYEFYNCEALEELYIKEGTLSKSLALAQSSKLNDNSRQSIVDGFADMTGQTSPSLTVHSTVYEKMVANGQDALLTAKNVTLVKA